MKRSTKFFAGLAAAALTFTTLTLTLGPRHYGWGDHRYAYGSYGHHRHSCEPSGKDKAAVKSDSTINTY
jgi:hypothetical protein